MKKILLLTSRNVLTTCGELRLIKNRANALYNVWGIHTDVIAISSFARIEKRNERLEFTEKESIIGISATNPISVIRGIKKLTRDIDGFLDTGDYAATVLSGVGTMFLANHIKQKYPNIKLVSDIHGSNEDIIEFGKGKNFLYRIKQRVVFTVATHSENQNIELMDGVFVVSKGLKQYLENRCKINNLNCYIAPCAINEATVSFDNNDINRKKYREKYRIDSETALFIYSGGVSPWQCIEESICIFNAIKGIINRPCKMLVLSHDNEEIQRINGGNKDIIVDSYSADEVKNVLCAGDFAFLIRKDCVTNNVAYPNKFLEYVESGMKVISTPYVWDVAEQTEQYGVGYILENENYEGLAKYVNEYFGLRNDFKKREELLLDTGFANRLTRFVKDFYDI